MLVIIKYIQIDKETHQFELSLFECNVNAAFPSCFLFFVIMSTHFTFCVLYSFNSKQSRLKLIRISTRQQYYFNCFLSLEIRRINNLFLYLGIWRQQKPLVSDSVWIAWILGREREKKNIKTRKKRWSLMENVVNLHRWWYSSW